MSTVGKPVKSKIPAKTLGKLKEQLDKAAGIAGDIVPKLVTHSSKLSAGSTLVITPIGPNAVAFPGDKECVGAHLLPLGQKLDCVTNSIHIPVLRLAQHRLGVHRAIDSGDAGNDGDGRAADEAAIVAGALKTARGLDAALAALEAGAGVSDFVPPMLPQLLIPDGDGYLAITPLACGAVQAAIKDVVARFEDAEWEEWKRDPAHYRRSVPTTPWQQAVGKMQNLSSTARHRNRGALHAEPPVSNRDTRTAIGFAYSPAECLGRLSSDLKWRNATYARSVAALRGALGRGFEASGTTKEADAREDAAAARVFNDLAHQLEHSFRKAQIDAPDVESVAAALAHWLEVEFKSVTRRTLRRWTGIALVSAQKYFGETGRAEAPQ